MLNDTIKLIFPWLYLALNLSVALLSVDMLSVSINTQYNDTEQSNTQIKDYMEPWENEVNWVI